MAAGLASMFYIGITVGRLLNGFLAIKLSDKALIRTGLGIISVGIILIFIPFHSAFSVIGFIVAGLGCAPIYPCIIHMTPNIFGREKSQAIIGMQMAFAYIGFLTMPPLFGLIADYISLPAFLLMFLVIRMVTHEITIKKAKSNF
jgi:MFS family permease